MTKVPLRESLTVEYISTKNEESNLKKILKRLYEINQLSFYKPLLKRTKTVKFDQHFITRIYVQSYYGCVTGLHKYYNKQEILESCPSILPQRFYGSYDTAVYVLEGSEYSGFHPFTCTFLCNPDELVCSKCLFRDIRELIKANHLPVYETFCYE